MGCRNLPLGLWILCGWDNGVGCPNIQFRGTWIPVLSGIYFGCILLGFPCIGARTGAGIGWALSSLSCVSPSSDGHGVCHARMSSSSSSSPVGGLGFWYNGGGAGFGRNRGPFWRWLVFLSVCIGTLFSFSISGCSFSLRFMISARICSTCSTDMLEILLDVTAVFLPRTQQEN